MTDMPLENPQKPKKIWSWLVTGIALWTILGALWGIWGMLPGGYDLPQTFQPHLKEDIDRILLGTDRGDLSEQEFKEFRAKLLTIIDPLYAPYPPPAIIRIYQKRVYPLVTMASLIIGIALLRRKIWARFGYLTLETISFFITSLWIKLELTQRFQAFHKTTLEFLEYTAQGPAKQREMEHLLSILSLVPWGIILLPLSTLLGYFWFFTRPPVKAQFQKENLPA